MSYSLALVRLMLALSAGMILWLSNLEMEHVKLYHKMLRVGLKSNKSVVVNFDNVCLLLSSLHSVSSIYPSLSVYSL